MDEDPFERQQPEPDDADCMYNDDGDDDMMVNETRPRGATSTDHVWHEHVLPRSRRDGERAA